jgi:TPR repeat protein
MNRTRLFVAAIFVAATLLPHSAEAQLAAPSNDPLRHGHALLIGNSHYRDRGWARLDDIPQQLRALEKGLTPHFDTVQVEEDLETEQLRQKINSFLRTYGNDSDARLFIYYAGHGYTEVIRERNENRGYITGIDTPKIDFTPQSFASARPRAISMAEIRAPVEDVLAKHILFVFDSCFAGTIFTNRSANEPPRPLVPDMVGRLLDKPARDFITAGSSNEPVPAHSPLPELFLEALDGAADPYKHGVVSTVEIHQYVFDKVSRIRDFKLTPQIGKLPNPAFAEGAFLFRVINLAIPAKDESETLRRYHTNAAKGDVSAQINLAYLYQNGSGGLSKDEREAARLYKLAADQGNATAQTNLGYFYEQGRGGLPKNEQEAARLYKLAADQENATAQSNLGFFYEQGRGGLPNDDREAARLYKLAADRGNAAGQAGLGFFYSRGRGGVPMDDNEAARLFKLAADQGNANAQANLGLFYDSPRGGLQKDDREAVRLYKLAADQGNASAQANLGFFYETGRGGLKQDNGEAERLYKLAADQRSAYTEITTVFELEGTWAAGGSPGPKISRSGNALTVDMSAYSRRQASGSVIDAQTIIVTFNDEGTHAGRLWPSGTDEGTHAGRLWSSGTIGWSNRTFWTKLTGSAIPGKQTTPSRRSPPARMNAGGKFKLIISETIPPPGVAVKGCYPVTPTTRWSDGSSFEMRAAVSAC